MLDSLEVKSRERQLDHWGHHPWKKLKVISLNESISSRIGFRAGEMARLVKYLPHKA